MEDFVEDCYVETDEEYEFDASQFYDFTKPEDDSEIKEVERWFEVSGDYPHSPFIVKLNLEKILYPEDVSSSSTRDSKNIRTIRNSLETSSRHGVSHSKKNAKEKRSPIFQNTTIAKTRAGDKLCQPRSLTFMEPTFSHLAKQHKVHEKDSNHVCTRFQRTSTKLNQKTTSTGFDNIATKRQKLETGYLKKASHLKHQFWLSHKLSKKVTIPREPELETQLRAQRRRSKNSFASSESEKQKQKGYNLKASPLNKKVLKACSLPQPRKSKPQSPEFQGSHSKTIQRATHHSSAKENSLTVGGELPESSLIQEFTKLSLGSNLETNNALQLERHSSAKDLDKDVSDSLQTEYWRCDSKPNQCGGHIRIHEANMTRSLDIR